MRRLLLVAAVLCSAFIAKAASLEFSVKMTTYVCPPGAMYTLTDCQQVGAAELVNTLELGDFKILP